MSIPSPVTVVGAGFLGRAVVEDLHAAGHEVIATTRSGKLDPPLEGVPVRRLDILDDDAQPTDVLAGASSIVLCYSSGGRQDRRRVYVDGGARILRAIATLRPRRLVYTSSTSALPDVDGPVDEDCDVWPDHERGRVQREAEQLVADTMGRAGIPWLVLRLAGLYGPGRELGRIYRSDPTRVLPGDGMRRTNLIHRDDASSAVLAALAQPPDVTGIIHVCDDDHCTRRQMYARVASAAEGAAARWERAPAPNAPPRGKQVSNARMKRVLGITLAHPRHGPAD